jgi:hypothetical protein
MEVRILFKENILKINFWFFLLGFANYLSTFAERLELGEYVPDVNDQTKARGLVLKK